ncbi:MAG: dihydrodipicolinate synthase family protein [Woeseiaceae bacterium]
MNGPKKIEGILAALVTPFDDKGDLDVERARAHLERLIEVGIHGFYVGGSTGEGMFQSVDERCEYMRFVADVAQGRVLLIAQVGSLSSRDVHALAEFASTNDYDAISSTPPFFFNHSDAEIVDYYRDLAECSDLPVLLYNIPGLTGRSLPMATQKEMLSIPNVVGSKHTDPNLFSAERLLREMPSAAVFNGFDEMLTGGLAMGMVGGIGSTYNLMPKHYLDIYDAVGAGDLDRARQSQAIVNEVIEELIRVSPGVTPAIKLGLRQLGFDMGEARRPFLPISGDTARFEELLLNSDGI